MSFYREVTTGQIVEAEPPCHLDGLARWERTEEEPSAPLTSYQIEMAAIELAAAAEESDDSNDNQEPADGDAEAERLRAELALTELQNAPQLPGADAERDVWIAYAHANGKTEADTKGANAKTIASWFKA